MRTLVALTLMTALFAQNSFARARGKVETSDSTLSYDLSASSGNQNGNSYTELTLGLNWQFQNWLTWRNAIFTRQGTGIESVQGLDSSARFTAESHTDGGGFGVEAFAGPGLRFASKSNNAIFGEAGVVFQLGGLRIGAGAKALNYIANREDTSGAALPKNETQYFLILAGGGTL